MCTRAIRSPSAQLSRRVGPLRWNHISRAKGPVMRARACVCVCVCVCVWCMQCRVKNSREWWKFAIDREYVFADLLIFGRRVNAHRGFSSFLNISIRSGKLVKLLDFW